MSWRLSVNNGYVHDLSALGKRIKVGGSREFPDELGSTFVEVPGLGAVNFIDIGDEEIGGPSHATWGVLISYQGEECVFRYEGEGAIEVTVNNKGQAELHGNGVFALIPLHPIALPGS